MPTQCHREDKRSQFPEDQFLSVPAAASWTAQVQTLPVAQLSSAILAVVASARGGQVKSLVDQKPSKVIPPLLLLSMHSLPLRTLSRLLAADWI